MWLGDRIKGQALPKCGQSRKFATIWQEHKDTGCKQLWGTNRKFTEKVSMLKTGMYLKWVLLFYTVDENRKYIYFLLLSIIVVWPN